MNEQDLSPLLHRLEATLPEIEPSVPTMIDGGRRLQRRRRRVIGAVIATAAASAIVATLLALPGATGRGDVGPEPTQPPPAGHPTDEELWTWARQLPLGEPGRIAYGFGNHVLDEGRLIDFPPGLRVHLLAPVQDGWLARVGEAAPGNSETNVREAFVGLDGSVRYFDYQVSNGNGKPVGEVASPDGTQVAYGLYIVDVATGRPVDALPTSLRFLDAWTSNGIETDAGRRDEGYSYVWQPGHTPVRLRSDGFVRPDLLIRYGSKCIQGFHLVGGEPMYLGPACGTSFADVSGSGRVILSDGRIVQDRRVVARFPVPFHPDEPGFDLFAFGASCCGIRWEDDSHLLISMQKTFEAGGAPRNLLVRCVVRTSGLGCERASDVFITYGSAFSTDPPLD